MSVKALEMRRSLFVQAAAEVFCSIGVLAALSLFIAPGVAAEEKQDAKAVPLTLKFATYEGYVTDWHEAEFKKLIKEKHGWDIELEKQILEEDRDFFKAVRGLSCHLAIVTNYLLHSPSYSYIDAKLVLPLDLEKIPNFDQLLDPMKNAAFLRGEDGKVYAAPMAQGPLGLFYNTDLLDEAPTSWQVFWDEKRQGEYAVSKEPSLENIYICALASGLKESQLGSYTDVNVPAVREKLEKLIANAKNLWSGVDTVEELKDVRFATSWGDSINALKELGQNWKRAEPAEGTLVWIDCWVMSPAVKERPELKILAEEWMNFSLSPASQAFYLRDTDFHYFPLTKKIRDHLTEEENAQFQFDEEELSVPYPTLDFRAQNGFEGMWKKAWAASGRDEAAETDGSAE